MSQTGKPYCSMTTSSTPPADEKVELITKVPSEQKRRSPLFGYFLILLTAILYTFQTIIQDYTLKDLKVSVYPYLFWRGVLNTLLSILYIFFVKDARTKIFRISQQELLLLLKLTVTIVCIANTYAVSLKYCISANSASLNESSPIFLYIYSYFFRHLPLSMSDILSLTLNISGVALILQSNRAASSRLIGSLFAFSSALFGAIFMTLSKEAAKSMNFIFPAVSGDVFLIFLGLSFADFNDIVNLLVNTSQFVHVALVGMCVFFGHCIVTIGLMHCRADRASLILMMNIPASYLLGFFVLGEKLKV